MYITLQTDYAIRIVDCLSKSKDIKCAQEISEEACVPLRFAKNILQLLTAKGIIASQKGMYGGYKLARVPECISLYDVFMATGEPTIMNRCLKTEYECNCSPDKQCVYYDAFMKISTGVENKLRDTKFS